MAVVVTTLHKGVFFGYPVNYTVGDTTMLLKQGRCCIYWSKDMRGFMGLAAFGPSEGCRIGPPADIELRDITSVVQATAVAAACWEKAPWSE